MSGEVWQTEEWESIDFPLISRFDDKWARRNFTLSNLKLLLKQESLTYYEDYVIHVNPEYKDYRTITVRFREKGQGLIVLLKWVSSNTFKGI